jgi:hypothetical protein
VVCLVDDQDRPTPGLGNKASDLAADLAKESGTRPLDRQAHLPGDGLVEVHDVPRGEADIEDAVQSGVQRREDLAGRAGLAASGVPGDEPDAAHLE